MSEPVEHGTFTGAGGQTISWWSWAPEGAVRSVVVLAHGFGEHCGRYAQLIDRLVGSGYGVVALDHQGHGHSTGTRALIRFAPAVADIDTLLDVTRRAYPDRPIVLLGHSMGGSLAIRYALAHGERLHGLVLSAPLAEVEGRPLAQSVGRLLGRIAPRLPVAKLDPADVSRDPAVVAAYRADPLVHHGAVPAGTASEFLRHADTLPDDVARVQTQTLLMYGTADRLCRPTGSEMIASRIGASDLTVVPFEGLYHEIFNEPERDRVTATLIDWLDERASPPAESAV